MLLKILFPVEHLVTVVTLDVLGSCVNDHVGLYVGFLGKGLATYTAPEVLLTFRTRADQMVTSHKQLASISKTTHEDRGGVPKLFSSIGMICTLAP